MQRSNASKKSSNKELHKGILDLQMKDDTWQLKAPSGPNKPLMYKNLLDDPSSPLLPTTEKDKIITEVPMCTNESEEENGCNDGVDDDNAFFSINSPHH